MVHWHLMANTRRPALSDFATLLPGCGNAPFTRVCYDLNRLSCVSSLQRQNPAQLYPGRGFSCVGYAACLIGLRCRSSRWDNTARMWARTRAACASLIKATPLSEAVIVFALDTKTASTTLLPSLSSGSRGPRISDIWNHPLTISARPWFRRSIWEDRHSPTRQTGRMDRPVLLLLYGHICRAQMPHYSAARAASFATRVRCCWAHMAACVLLAAFTFLRIALM
jgi:hypothetical protein